MTWTSTLRRAFGRIRFRMAAAAPITVAGRRPVVLTEADLDDALARRRLNRAARSAACRKGWVTRRNHPLDDTGRGVAPVSTSARAGFGSSAPLSHSCGGSAAPIADGSGWVSPTAPTGRGPASPSGANRAVNPCLLNL